MRRLIALAVIVTGGCTSPAPQRESAPPPSPTPATQAEPLSFGPHHHPISTSSADAQKMFDQGLAQAFGFNHEAAIRSFERTAELDPSSPMPHWGQAWARGPNYNLDIDDARGRAAPAHVYARTGDHAAAAAANAAGAAADRRYRVAAPPNGMYGMMYYPHNLQFLADSHMLQGQFADAKQAADRVAERLNPHAGMMPMVESMVVMPVSVLMRFSKHADLLGLQAPTRERTVQRAWHHFARGITLAKTGKVDEAADERTLPTTAIAAVPETAAFGGGGWASAASALRIAGLSLDARIAAARREHDRAVKYWQQAYRELIVAPVALRERLTALIDREVEHHRAGRQAGIIVKINAILDPGIIQVLYGASREGASVSRSQPLRSRRWSRGRAARLLSGSDGALP